MTRCALVPKLLRDLVSLPRQIASASWELKVLPQAESTYVSLLADSFRSLWADLMEMAALPPQIREEVWGHAVEAAATQLVEGYARYGCDCDCV